MKGINTSIFDFPTLRDPASNYVYVDKTAQLYEIAKPSADRIYYLPRPRRFGKSLMISTLKALFEGRREAKRTFAADPRPVWYVAINYNDSTRTLDDPLCEPAMTGDACISQKPSRA